jgi:hypothetical protein
MKRRIYKKKIARRKSKFQILQHMCCNCFNGQVGVVVFFSAPKPNPTK